MLTPEAKSYLEPGSPEAQLFRAIPDDGVGMADLKVWDEHLCNELCISCGKSILQKLQDLTRPAPSATPGQPASQSCR